MFIQIEPIPKPKTVKFLPSKKGSLKKNVFYKESAEAEKLPLARRLFFTDKIDAIFLESDFFSLTKNDDLEWQLLEPLSENFYKKYYGS